ncbi:hypothetical protein R6Q57_024306 [Mikania cordata]
MVEPSFAKRSVINHHEYLPGASIITSDAIGIDKENQVSTTEGRQISFDYLVIATGHMGNCHVTKTERLRQFEADYEKIKSSDTILIVGGGPTGVELAGEIAVDFPAKKVKLVHRGLRLLEFIGETAGKKALDWLTAKNVEVILGQSVNLDSGSNGAYLTSIGETIVADCHFKCTSDPIGSSWLKETILKDCLDDFGRLMVDANLRVKGFSNIFAIGDVTDVPELKQGYLAHRHALVVANNLKLLIEGGDESKMAKYCPATSPMAIVSLGRREALGQIRSVTLIGRIPGMLKSKDLFVGKTRKQLGLQGTVSKNTTTHGGGSGDLVFPFLSEQARCSILNLVEVNTTGGSGRDLVVSAQTLPSDQFAMMGADLRLSLIQHYEILGRRVSNDGVLSSLDYLFGSGEPKPTTSKIEVVAAAPVNHVASTNEPPPKPTAIVPQPDITNQIPTRIQGTQTAARPTISELWDRPSTKVHVAPGGGSSLGYLFGGGGWLWLW